MTLRFRYYDIHSHILPGIDDGPKTVEEALGLAKAYVEDGAVGVIATPHVTLTSDFDEFTKLRDKAFDELKGALAREEIGLEIKLGSELMIGPTKDKEHDYQAVERYAKQLCLADTNLILVEYPEGPEPIWFAESLYRLQKIRLQPVIAHTERYSWLKDRKKLSKLRDKGIYSQVNTEGLNGMLRPMAIQMRSLVKDGLIHFVATDAHDARRRKPRLGTANYGNLYWQLANSKALFSHSGDHVFYTS